MLDIGWTELVVVAIVLIIVVGPKDLPPMLRAFGRMTSKMRGMAGDFRKQFDEALKEADLDDVRKTIGDAQKLNPVNSLREAINPLRQMGNEIKSDLQKSVSDTPRPQVAAGDTPELETALGTSDKPSEASQKPADTVAAAAVASARKQVANAEVTAADKIAREAVKQEAAKPEAKRTAKKVPATKQPAPAAKSATAGKAQDAKTAGTAAKAAKPKTAARTAKTKKGDA